MERPEIYHSKIARSTIGVEAGDWHLSVRPGASLRPLSGVPNVFFFDPLFQSADEAPGGILAFISQRGLLRQANVVACATPRGARLLQENGIEPVVLLPPPLSSAAGSAGFAPPPPVEATFVAYADWERFAQDLAHVLRTFRVAKASQGSAKLIVKVAGIDDVDQPAMRRRAADLADYGGNDEAVSFVLAGSPGSRGELARAPADFVICVTNDGRSPAAIFREMANGTIPLVVAGSVLDGLVPEAASIRIRSDADAPGKRSRSIFGETFPSSSVPSADQLAATMVEAVRRSPAQRAAMASACQHAASEMFGMQAFRSGLERLLSVLHQDRA